MTISRRQRRLPRVAKSASRAYGETEPTRLPWLPSFQCYCCLGDSCKMFYDTRLLFGRLVQNVLWHTSAVWETCAKCVMATTAVWEACAKCFVAHYCCLGDMCKMFYDTLMLFGWLVCNGAEWSKDRTQAAESIKWRPQQAYGSNQVLLSQPQTIFSTPKILTLTHR